MQLQPNLLAGVILLTATLRSSAAPATEDVFVSGHDGYHTFRIPAAVTTTQGTVLAFAEGRKHGGGDSGDIDLVLKRSTDGGRTWSKLQVVWDHATNTCGNPCPVVDRDSGHILLLTTWNRGGDHEPQIIAQTSRDTRRIFVTRSADDGHTWSKPREITADVKLTNWTWYATGPGAGIQLQRGAHKGRLIIPCDHIEAGTKRYFSHIISCLVMLPDGDVGCFYEADGYRRMVFARFTLDWLLDRNTPPAPADILNRP